MKQEIFFYTQEFTSRELYEYDDSILLGTMINPTRSKAPSQPIISNQKRMSVFTPFNIAQINTIVKSNSLNQKILIRIDSKFKKAWDVAKDLIIVYNIITTLYFLAFEYPKDAILAVDKACWGFFILDIFLSFITERVTTRGLTINRHSLIALRYFKGWFFLDVLAVIPLSFTDYEMIEYFLRLVRLWKLSKVFSIKEGALMRIILRLFRLGKKDEKGQIMFSYTDKIIASIFQLFLAVIFIVYCLGCVWYWFQNFVNDFKYSSDIQTIPETSVSDENNFSFYYLFDSLKMRSKVLHSCYYILTTISTIGYGDFHPQNIYEMGFILATMLFGVALFGFIMGNFNSAIAYYTEATTGEDYIGSLNMWLHSLERVQGKIPKVLRKKVIEHFIYYFSKDRLKSLAKNYWESKIHEDLVNISQEYVSSMPDYIYYEILENLFSDFLITFRQFFGEGKLRYAILPHLQPRRYEINDKILATGTLPDELAFVVSGVVNVKVCIEEINRSLLRFSDPMVIGDYQLLTDLPSNFDYVAKSQCECFSINSEVFLKIVNIFFKSQKNDLLAYAAKREKMLKKLLNDSLKIRNELIVIDLTKDLIKKINIKRKQTAMFFGEEFVASGLDSLNKQQEAMKLDFKKVFRKMRLGHSVKEDLYSSLKN